MKFTKEEIRNASKQIKAFDKRDAQKASDIAGFMTHNYEMNKE